MTDLSPHIAIIDDDVSVRRSLHRLLKSAGYEVSDYESAEAFLASSHFGDVSCLLLDVQMPGISGLDLQGVIGDLRAPLPVVFITAHRDEQVRARALARGAIGFLEKPFDDDALIDLIQKAIQRPAA